MGSRCSPMSPDPRTMSPSLSENARIRRSGDPAHLSPIMALRSSALLDSEQPNASRL